MLRRSAPHPSSCHGCNENRLLLSAAALPCACPALFDQEVRSEGAHPRCPSILLRGDPSTSLECRTTRRPWNELTIARGGLLPRWAPLLASAPGPEASFQPGLREQVPVFRIDAPLTRSCPFALRPRWAAQFKTV
jgi:hypothetical protein